MQQAVPNETTTIHLAQSGNAKAQGDLVQLWYPRIYNFAFKYFGDSDMAHDAAQQAFISMHKSIHKLRDKASFKQWIYAIAANICRQESRKAKRHRWLSFDQLLPNGDDEVSPKWEVSVNRSSNPEQSYLQNELGATVQGCIKKLSTEQREVLIMKEYEGLKFREIAEILKISENTVKSRLYYAFAHMKKLLAKENITQKTVRYES